MNVEAFPEIENFHKLPHQVIVKGASSTYDREQGAFLHGIVINNIGHTICNVTTTSPDRLPQGAIGAFSFQIKDYHEEIKDYHLFTSWKFFDKE
jgi:hypothetical protein